MCATDETHIREAAGHYRGKSAGFAVSMPNSGLEMTNVADFRG